MSKGNTFENDLLKLFFNGTAIANLADNAASSPFTSLYLALHTADPGEGGDQTTSEISFTGYARRAVTRDNTGFTVSAAVVSLAADATFGPCTAGSGVATHFSIGTASSGGGKILYSGTITPNLTIANGTTAVLSAGTIVTED